LLKTPRKAQFIWIPEFTRSYKFFASSLGEDDAVEIYNIGRNHCKVSIYKQIIPIDLVHLISKETALDTFFFTAIFMLHITIGSEISSPRLQIEKFV